MATKVTQADRTAARMAAQVLAGGGLVAFPTETVYGLGADATVGAAVARIYAAKERPQFNPLIAHVPDLQGAYRLGRFNTQALALASAFWPGPLTLVVPKAEGCPVADLATAGLDTVAIRMPAHPVAQAILQAFGKPVCAPSANRSGHVSPTAAAHVLRDLKGRVDLIVDGGATQVGIESTIVACIGDAPVLLRPGGLPREAIEAKLGVALAVPAAHDESKPLAPGMLASHYAPRVPVRLDATSVSANEALLAFGPAPLRGSDVTLNLSVRGDTAEAAANLFGHLRELDDKRPAAIAVMPIPHSGLGEAINDRLRRAAAPRA
ncbi:L-threonylcarbamoyladenylate synthase [Variibacter gotjawalensis]|uniref:L-threonylcarbamoyladenylate synthase n=2 Tax=Variibacter gotjawalensis TaxID=1333996 RepID=UPI003D3202DC